MAKTPLDELADAKARLNQAKNTRLRLEGARDAAKTELKKLGYSSVAAAEKAAAQLDAQIGQCMEEIGNGIARLREVFP